MPVGAQQIYKWTDANGQVHFSDQPPPAAARENAEVVGTLQRPATVSTTKPAAPPVVAVPSEYQRMTPERSERLERESRANEQRLADEAREKQEATDRQKAETQKVSDQQMMANCLAHREWYCNKPTEEVRRIENEKAWRLYDLGAATPCLGNPTSTVPCVVRPPVRPDGPRPRMVSDAQRIYERNAGQHHPPPCLDNGPMRKGVDVCKD